MKYYSAFGVILISFSIHKILELKSEKWILTNQDLILKSGFLPWRRSYFDVPVDNIYEAFYTQGFFSHLFGYGHLYIRRTEGSTSNMNVNKMTNHKEMTGKINSIIREVKSNRFHPHSTSPSHSGLADELMKLSELRQQGVITESEFEEMKRRLIG